MRGAQESGTLYIERQPSTRWLTSVKVERLHPNRASLGMGSSFYGKRLQTHQTNEGQQCDDKHTKGHKVLERKVFHVEMASKYSLKLNETF